MTTWTRLRAWGLRLAGSFGAGRRDRAIAEELSTHLEMMADEHRRRGLTDDQAGRAAAASFGSVAAAVEACRDRRGLPWLEHWIRDAVFAVRSLRRVPLTAASMVLVLALGIGMGTAILMMLHAAVWRTLPVPEADRVVKLSLGFQGEFSRRVLGHASRFSYPELTSYRENARAVAAIAGFRDEPMLWRHDGDARPLNGLLVTADYFATLRVSPAAGRLLSSGDEHTAAIVISERLWRDAFAGRPDILGRTMILDRRPCTVVGVVAAPFTGTEMAPTDVWLPVESTQQARGAAALLSEANTGWLMAVGRLAPDASLETARAEAGVIAARLDAAYPGRRTLITVTRASALDAALFGDADRGKLLGTGAAVSTAVIVLLLICGSNVGGLLLARGAARHKEFALRIALGASRARIAQQLIAEIGIITLAGAMAGIAVCAWTLRLLGQLSPLAGVTASIALDWRTLAIAALAGLVIAALFGIAPARQALRVDCLEGLKGDAAILGTHVPAARLRGWIVSIQVAISLVLLVAAALAARGIERTFRLDPGYATPGLFDVRPDLAASPSDPTVSHRTPLVQQLSAALAAAPGIRGVGLAMVAPFGGAGSSSAATDKMPAPVAVHFNKVDDGYFPTLGVPVMAGRGLSAGDVGVVLINAALARSFWGSEQSAVGRMIAIPNRGDGGPTRTVEIAGVVPTLQTMSLGMPDGPTYYEPLEPGERAGAVLIVRADKGVALPRLALDTARTLDRDAFVNVTSIEQRIAARTGVARVAGTAAGFIGLLALLVAAVGIHGIVAHAVTCRTRDIGVRLALGASRAQVLRLVLRQTMSGVALGAMAGATLVAVATLSFSEAFRTALFGINPLDPVACIAAGLTLTVISLGAAWLPARRAAGISPIAALRQD